MGLLRLALPLALAASLAATNRAEAYNCSPTGDGRFTQVWMSRCIPYMVSTNGELLDSEERIRLVQQSFEVWSGEACTDLNFKYNGTTDRLDGFDVQKPEDQINVVVSIEDQKDLESFDDPRLLALTLTRYSIASGEILDADILLNEVNHDFAETDDVSSCRATMQVFDLRNTLVHEIGHFIGFDHTDVSGATMEATAEPCEIIKRDLHQDDRDAVCATYPAGQPTRTCKPPPTYTPSDGLDPEPFRDQCTRKPLTEADAGGCSCAASKQSASSSWMLVLLGAVLFIGRRTSALLRRS